MQSLWMVAAGLSFALMGVCVKYGAAQFSAAELVFYRALVQTAGAWVLLTHQGLSVRTARQTARGGPSSNSSCRGRHEVARDGRAIERDIAHRNLRARAALLPGL